MGVGEALIGGGAAMFSTALQAGMTKRAQIRGNQYAVHNYKHRYQWGMEDMKAAGLNPMLVYGSGGAPGNVGTGQGMGSISPTNIAQSAREGMLMRKEATVKSREAELKAMQTNESASREAYFHNMAGREAHAADKEASLAEAARLALPGARNMAWLQKHPQYRAKMAADAMLETAHSAKDLVNPMAWIFGGGRGKMKPGQGPTKIDRNKGPRIPMWQNPTYGF